MRLWVRLCSATVCPWRARLRARLRAHHRQAGDADLRGGLGGPGVGGAHALQSRPSAGVGSSGGCERGRERRRLPPRAPPTYGGGMESKATIYDVARVAGVAASTVSRAFARPGRVNAETAQRVFAAAATVGYRSSALSGLTGPTGSRTRTRSLALVVTDITNPFYSEIIRGAHEAAGAARLHDPALAHAGGRPARARLDRARAGLRGRRRAGQLAHVGQRDPHDRQAEADGGAQPAHPRGAVRASPTTRGACAGRSSTSAELGHDTITYVAGPEASWADGVRWQALREAAYELELRVRRVGPCHTPTVHAGFDITPGAARPTPPDGGASPTTTCWPSASSRACAGRGCRCPTDVSVVGFDNVLLAEIVDPELTTVAAPLRAHGDDVRHQPHRGHRRRGTEPASRSSCR